MQLDWQNAAGCLPSETIVAVFARYGRSLAAPLPALSDEATVDWQLSSGRTLRLRMMSIRGFGDVIPNDYLILEVEGEVPLCAPAPLVSAALTSLARAVAGETLVGPRPLRGDEPTLRTVDRL